MRKRIFLILYIIICSFRTDIIYGSENFYKTDEKTYINGVLIDSYEKYIIAEDLRNYGFDVTWDAENKILNINRIPDSFPTTSTIIKIRSPQKEDRIGKIIFQDVRITDYRVIIDGIDLEYYNLYFTKDGTLIPIKVLDKYGSFKKIEGETDYYYITLSYNYPVVTAPDGTGIKITQPVYDYARDILLKEVNPNTTQMLTFYTYVKKPQLSGITEIMNDTYGGTFYPLQNEIYLDASILNEFNLDYIISDNKLTILSMPSKEIKMQYRTHLAAAIGEYPDFNQPPLAGRYGEGRPDEIAELSCVDLKLFSKEKEIKTENKFPSFLDCNGKLVVKLQDLAEALQMDFKKTATENYEYYYEMVPKQ